METVVLRRWGGGGGLLKDDLALSTELKMKLVTVFFKLQSFVRANTKGYR